MLVAAGGALLFASGQSYTALLAGRALIGLGVSGCLMASFQAWVLLHPPERIAMLNGIAFATGGLGAITASVPLELLLRLLGWREIFLILVAFNFAIVAVLATIVPERAPHRRGETLAQSLQGVGRILGDPAFWRIGLALFGL